MTCNRVLLFLAGVDAAQKSQVTISTLQSRVSELEVEIHKMRTSTSVVSSLFQLPTKQDVLAGQSQDGILCSVLSHVLEYSVHPSFL